MSATPRGNRRATVPGRYFLFKIPRFFNLLVKIFQSTLILIGIGDKTLVLFSKTSILDLELWDCLIVNWGSSAILF